MSGSKTNLSKKKDEILAATAVRPREGDFIWDGKDEDDRPLSKAEIQAGIKGPSGRPRLANRKRFITIRLKAEVLEFFKADGKGWQTKINKVLQDYVDAAR